MLAHDLALRGFASHLRRHHLALCIDAHRKRFEIAVAEHARGAVDLLVDLAAQVVLGPAAFEARVLLELLDDHALEAIQTFARLISGSSGVHLHGSASKGVEVSLAAVGNLPKLVSGPVLTEVRNARLNQIA